MEVYTEKDLRKGMPSPEECTETEYKVFEFLESTGADYTWLAHGLKFAVSEYEEVCWISRSSATSFWRIKKASFTC